MRTEVAKHHGRSRPGNIAEPVYAYEEGGKNDFGLFGIGNIEIKI